MPIPSRIPIPVYRAGRAHALARPTAARVALVAALLAAALGAGASSADAAGSFGCRASAVRLTGLGVVNLEPAVANGSAAQCTTQNTSVIALPPPFGALVSVQSASAQTAASSGSAEAHAGVVSPVFLGLLGGIEAQTLTASAHAQCAGGHVVSSSSSQVVGLTVNGTSYGSVGGPQTISLPGVGTLYVNRTVVEGGSVSQRALELSLLPSLPGGLAGVDLVLGEASASPAAGSCSVSASAPIVHPPHTGSELGEPVGASEEAAGPENEFVPGSFAGRQAAAALALQCTRSGLTLIDVLIRHHRVVLFGAADKSLIGHTVAINLVSAHKRVATAVVGPDGLFGTTAPLPARKLRYTNKALYQAAAAGRRSAALKLVRRMHVTSIAKLGGRVVIRGRVSKPLALPIARIVFERRTSCRSAIIVAKARPRANGTFQVALPAPLHSQAAVYQARTVVRGRATSRATYPTFTLPRVVVVE